MTTPTRELFHDRNRTAALAALYVCAAVVLAGCPTTRTTSAATSTTGRTPISRRRTPRRTSMTPRKRFETRTDPAMQTPSRPMAGTATTLNRPMGVTTQMPNRSMGVSGTPKTRATPTPTRLRSRGPRRSDRRAARSPWLTAGSPSFRRVLSRPPRSFGSSRRTARSMRRRGPRWATSGRSSQRACRLPSRSSCSFPWATGSTPPTSHSL